MPPEAVPDPVEVLGCMRPADAPLLLFLELLIFYI